MENNIKTFTEDLYQILVKISAEIARDSQHTFVGTPHLFLALNKFFTKNKENTRYSSTQNIYFELLKGSGINSADLKNSFYKLFPQVTGLDSEKQDIIIKSDNEYNKIVSVLKSRAEVEKRSMEVEDFIAELYSDRAFNIYSILEDLPNMTTEKLSTFQDKMISTFKNVKRTFETDLDELPFLTNLNDYVLKHPQTLIGGNDILDHITVALSGRSTKSACIVGKAGTGKTSYVYELVSRIVSGNITSSLKNKIVYQLDPASLIAGTRFRGDFEQRLSMLVDSLKNMPNVIIFVDEAHQLMKLGGEDGGTSAANVFKPYLSKGEIQLILATTNEEYSKHILPQEAFARRFHKITVDEPSIEQTREILKGLISPLKEYFGKDLSNDLIEVSIKTSSKFNVELANPAKSINVLEFAMAYSKALKEDKKEVDLNDLYESIKMKFNIYLVDNKFEVTNNELHSLLLGQNEPLNKVVENLRIVDSELIDPLKPMYSMILAGPTGVGKTETAKIIAKNYFGSEKNLIRINMSEYSSEMDVSKLTGASPGYVGYEEETELIKQIRLYPNSVVLFDEIEKAHPSIYKTLLNILDEGIMKDNKAQPVSFRNAIIIFTTNLGYDKDFGVEKGIGFTKSKGDSSQIMNAIEKYFSPEFLGRIDDIVIYNALTSDIIDILALRYLNEFNGYSGKNITFNEEDMADIKKTARIEVSGARGLKSAVKKKMADILKKELVNKK